MATIANLSIGLSADSARLKKDLNQADKATKKWSNKQKKTFGGVTKSIKGMGAALAALGTGAYLRSMTTLAKELTTLSTLTSIGTTELQQLAPALDSIGISTEKYADIIKDTNDKMNDFLQTGGGPMKDFFEQIAPLVGITTDAFKGLSGKDALQLYVDSLEKAGLSQEQMTFYMEALASDSTMLLPLLRDNASAMERFGLAAGQAINEDTLGSLRNLGNQFAAITVIIRNAITNAFGPFINTLSQAVEGWRMLITDFPAILTGLGAVTAGVIALTVAMLANPVAFFVTAFMAVVAVIGLDYKKITEVSEAVGGFSEMLGLMASAAEFEFNRVVAYGTKLKLSLLLIFNSIQDAWQMTITNLSVTFGRWIDSIADTKMGEMLGLSGGWADAASNSGWDAMSGITDEFVELTTAMSENNKLLQEANPYAKKLADAFTSGKPIPTKPVGGGGSPDLTRGGSVGAGAAAGAGGSGPSSSTPNFYESLATDFVSGLKNAFSNALATGDWKGFLESALDSLTMGIISSFTEGLLKPFEDAIGGFMESLFSGMGSLGGGVGGGFGDFFGGLFGAANGGMVPTTPFSKSYADSVPTMLQPGELVVPVDQVDNFKNGGGGGGQTFNINVTGDVSRLTRSEIVKMMPEIAAGTNMLNKENGFR